MNGRIGELLYQRQLIDRNIIDNSRRNDKNEMGGSSSSTLKRMRTKFVVIGVIAERARWHVICIDIANEAKCPCALLSLQADGMASFLKYGIFISSVNDTEAYCRHILMALATQQCFAHEYSMRGFGKNAAEAEARLVCSILK